MGAGIAHAFLTRGSRVTVVEQHADDAAAARERVAASVSKSIERGLEVGAEALLARLTCASRMEALAGADLIIEAIPEDLDLKRRVLPALEAELSPAGVLASNTSSISITALAQPLARPERFLGLHFFNPVPASSLVEIVTHPGLEPGIAREAHAWVEALGKHAITVNDAPGFASSRLGLALALEAIRMVEAGVASAADIDLAMEQGYRHPAGPLKTTDIVGLDVRLGIAEQLHAELGENFRPPQLLREMVARGELGRKTGQGFYPWPD